jgi:predicted glycogen debranching enzyme
VEVNALWYNALCTMVDFAKRLGVDASEYTGYADSVKSGFNRFWNHELGYCFDVIDTPHGDDPSLRPNQLFAVSLHHNPLPDSYNKAIVDTCERHLYNPTRQCIPPGNYLGLAAGTVFTSSFTSIS